MRSFTALRLVLRSRCSIRYPVNSFGLFFMENINGRNVQSVFALSLIMISEQCCM